MIFEYIEDNAVAENQSFRLRGLEAELGIAQTVGVGQWGRLGGSGNHENKRNKYKAKPDKIPAHFIFFPGMYISKLEIIFCPFLAESDFVNALIPFIGVKEAIAQRFVLEGNLALSASSREPREAGFASVM